MKLLRRASETPAACRRGFSLMEVIIATAILLGSVVVLSQLLQLGRTQAQKALRLSEAQRMCEATLNEIILGLRPLQAVERVPLTPVVSAPVEPVREQFADDEFVRRRPSGETDGGTRPQWFYSVRLAPHESIPELTRLTVEVRRVARDRSRPVTFELTRWIRRDRSESPSEFEMYFGRTETDDRRRSNL